MCDKKKPTGKPSIVQTVFSVLAAFIGVQSRKNRVRDFKRGDYRHFIIVGLLFAALFVVALVLVVSMVAG